MTILILDLWKQITMALGNAQDFYDSQRKLLSSLMMMMMARGTPRWPPYSAAKEAKKMKALFSVKYTT